jgi:hypothetical protein
LRKKKKTLKNKIYESKKKNSILLLNFNNTTFKLIKTKPKTIFKYLFYQQHNKQILFSFNKTKSRYKRANRQNVWKKKREKIIVFVHL